MDGQGTGPFRPGAGESPPHLAGRDSEQDDFRRLLAGLQARDPPPGDVSHPAGRDAGGLRASPPPAGVPPDNPALRPTACEPANPNGHATPVAARDKSARPVAHPPTPHPSHDARLRPVRSPGGSHCSVAQRDHTWLHSRLVTPMQNIPLYFDLRETVVGQGFIAAVRMQGRATAVEDFGSTWIYGVNPGGLADHGSGLKTAYGNFRRSLVCVLLDFAEEAADFGAFSEAVRDFLEATNAESVAEWDVARSEIRNGRTPEVDLPAEKADLEMSVRITDLSATRPADLTPAINELEPQERLAA